MGAVKLRDVMGERQTPFNAGFELRVVGTSGLVLRSNPDVDLDTHYLSCLYWFCIGSPEVVTKATVFNSSLKSSNVKKKATPTGMTFILRTNQL
jgi:hypothetical protein